MLLLNEWINMHESINRINLAHYWPFYSHNFDAAEFDTKGFGNKKKSVHLKSVIRITPFYKECVTVFRSSSTRTPEPQSPLQPTAGMTLWPICPVTVAGSVLLCAHRQRVLWTVTTFSSHTPNAPAGLITEDIHTSPGPYSENHRHTWGTKLCCHWFSTELCVCLSSLLKLLLRWADMHKSWTLLDFSPLHFV